MKSVSNELLIQKAAAVIDEQRLGDTHYGDVGSALVSDSGKIFTGVCIDTPSGMGFCAEHTAVAAMVTVGENRVRKIVATWKDEDGVLYVIPPCGRCREFIYQINKKNLDAEIIIAKDRVVKLSELLPYCGEFNRV